MKLENLIPTDSFQGLVQLQAFLTVECLQLRQALHQQTCWHSSPYRTAQAPVAKLELKQVDHNSCSPGPRVGTRSEAPPRDARAWHSCRHSR